jgi:leucyl aminopeptidase (aminopeptidase T)
MQIVQKLTARESIRTLTPEELALGRQILEYNFSFKPGESVLVITDPLMLEQEAALWFETAKTLGAPVELFVLEGMTHSGQEPPNEVVAAVHLSDHSFFQTTFSLTHTQAGKAVVRAKKRGASLPGVDYAMLFRTLQADYQQIHELGEQLKTKLENSTTIQVTSEHGTDLACEIRRSQVINDSGIFFSGVIGNLPAGEVFFAPVLGTTQGTWVVNGSLADEDELDEPVVVTIVDGRAVAFAGGAAARRLEQKLRSVGDEGLVVAELGIGTNSTTHPLGSLIEAEKAYATAHLAFGNSSAIGGENNVPIHLDGLTLEPTITVDGKRIVAKKNFSFS